MIEQHGYSTVEIPGARIAIVQSKWYSEYVENIVMKCLDGLQRAKCGAIFRHTVPGCLELPLVCRDLLWSDNDIEAVVVVGILMKGETDHYDYILEQMTQLFTWVMWHTEVPILVEVLPVDSIEKVQARSGDNEFNKGIEAANAAIEIVDWKRKNRVPDQKGKLMWKVNFPTGSDDPLLKHPFVEPVIRHK